MPRASLLALTTAILAALAGSLPAAAPQAPPPPSAGAPGSRVLLDAHNCYPDGGQFADRIERALSTGLPVAIEQDLVWFRDPRSGVSRSILSHGEPFTGTEPSLANHFFERIRPLVEQALREGKRETWPLIVLNLDLKTNEPEHHAAIWETLGTYEAWLTTTARLADVARPAPLDVKPVLVLTGNPDAQQASFHDRVAVGGRLRVFGAIPVDVEAKVGKGKEAVPKLAGLTPAELIASGATNYRRWVNFPWAVVERGGQVEAGAWTPADAARLGALTSLAHARGLWIRFYTLNGHDAGADRGWTASYNFGSAAAVETRWRAARDAGVDFIASDQYEGLARVLARPPAVAAQGAASTGAPAPGERPGARGGGVTLLPNGWRIAPAGKHLQAGDFPLAMTATPDRRFLVITNNGFSKPSLTVIDTERWAMKARVPVEHAWLGLAWDAGGRKLYSAGAAENTVHVFDYAAGTLKQGTPMTVAPPALRLPPGTTDMAGTGFVGGIATAADGKTLYAVHVFGRAISAIDLASGAVRATVPLPAEPYTVLPAADGRRVFVSLWGGAKVLALDAATLAVTGEVAVGAHPNAMVLSKDGQRLFVACANTNKVWVLDTATLVAREQVGVSPFPEAPPGTTPNALAVSPDGDTLAVANADNNTIALIDIEQPGRSEVEGFIPTGWYPTSVLFDAAGKKLFVLSGKGLIGQANPRGPNVSPLNNGQYAGELLQGTVSVIEVPDAARLQAHTARVIALSAYSDARRLTPAGALDGSPIPRRVGDASPIRHVFYVIRENRTYDQVLGDMEQGNGDREPGDLRRGRDAERARAGPRVRPLRQLLRRRRGQLRRPRVLDRRLRHRRRREAVADQLRAARRRVSQRGRLRRSQSVRQPLRAERRLSLGLRDAGRDQRPQLRRVRRLDVHRRRHAPRRGDRARPQGQGPSHVSALRSVDPRRQTDRRLARGVPPVRGQRPAAPAERHPPRQRPHLRHAAGRPDAAFDGGRERRCARPAGRGDQPQHATGRPRRSSCSRTTRRTDPTTSIRTGHRPS